MKNILIASLGKKLEELTYTFENKEYKTKFCCLALTKLLDQNIDELCVLLTDEARKEHEATLLNETNDLGISLKIIEIPSGKSVDEIWAIFDDLTDKLLVDSVNSVTLDITNGFRHLPLLSFVSMAYLESSCRLSLDGIYYGAREASVDQKKIPVFNLTPFLSILKGSYSVKSFEDTGSVDQLYSFLSETLDLEAKDKEGLKDRLNLLNGNLQSGLSPESAHAADRLSDWISKKTHNADGFKLKAADYLLERLNKKIADIKLSQGKRGKNWKEKYNLDENELSRQLKLINWHCDTGNHSKAMLLAREWIVNRIWFCEQFGQKWLKVKDREKLVEHELGYWASKIKTDKESVKKLESYELINLWGQIADTRNRFAHCGFQNENVKFVIAEEKLKQFFELVDKNYGNNTFWKLPRRNTDDEQVLVSPMGASFGLLYSAVSLVKPDRIIALTSEKFRNQVIEACNKGGFTKAENIHLLIMEDVFSGFDEARDITAKILPLISNSKRVIINLTGGTTAMQWCMQSIYEATKRHHLPVERVAFIDRRSTSEQQSNPWQTGEIIEVEKVINKDK